MWVPHVKERKRGERRRALGGPVGPEGSGPRRGEGVR
jgi:hypothetical protein